MSVEIFTARRRNESRHGNIIFKIREKDRVAPQFLVDIDKQYEVQTFKNVSSS